MRRLSEYILESNREYSVIQWMGRKTAREMRNIDAVSLWLTHADEKDLEFVKNNNNVDHIFLNQRGSWFEYKDDELVPIETFAEDSNPAGRVCYKLNLGTMRTKPPRSKLDDIFKTNIFYELYVSLEDRRTITKYIIKYNTRTNDYDYLKVDV